MTKKNNGQEKPEEPSEEDAFESAPIHPKQVMVTDEELRNLQKEIMEYKDKYLRLLADADNARKRLHKEKQDLIQYAIESIVVDFLKPIDNLENALKFAQDMSDDVKNWAFGFQMILSQFKDILASNRVTSIDSLGTKFDPQLHEAVETVQANDKPPGVVIEEYVRGYKMGDRTIRPARVKVTKADRKENRQEPQENVE